MADCLRIGVGKNVRGNAPTNQLLLKLHHRDDLCENIAEPIQKLFFSTTKSGRLNHGIIELTVADEASLVAMQKRGLVDHSQDLLGGEAGLACHATCKDSVIEIEKHFAQVKNDGFRYS